MFKDSKQFIDEYKNEFMRSVVEPFETSDRQEKYAALVRLICGKAARQSVVTQQRQTAKNEKRVYYFSMEFLIGRLLKNYLITLGIEDIVRDGMRELGEDLDELCACERDPGLGNGGLGRLAACFLDSMACLGIAGYGMGIRYRYGLFAQKIENGAQTEAPDDWLDNGYPWENRKIEDSMEVRFGGVVERKYCDGKMYFQHHGYQSVRAVPYDVPIIGCGGETVNMLRLWRAVPMQEEFDLAAFNRGDYSGAVRDRNEVEAITCILYPDDSNEAGKRLRLKQEYFFVAAGLASILQKYKERYGADWAHFAERVAVHINDTHPALCAPELIRIFIDEEGLSWDEAWDITTKTISYTNHTVLPEALERWSIDLVRTLLPRVYMIIEEIDRRYRESFDYQQPGWQECLKATAILWDGQVRMANLSVIGSHSVNGVAALHTEILKKDVLKDFYRLEPQKFNNKTNGISHRRFLIEANPGLTALLNEAIGTNWQKNPNLLTNLLALQGDGVFLWKLAEVKRANKLRLADYIKEKNGIEVDPNSVFDVQVKRIHAYKRQLLNVFKIMELYNRLHECRDTDFPPHTFIFAGKAAQGYVFAKEVIRLICSVAELVNNDPVCRDKIKVVFIENFNVSTAQLIYPAADISEQISTAGKEASGTGNMKFMFNGALTLGTLDGANIEILEQVGRENICIFGLTAEQVAEYYTKGGYWAFDECKADPRLQKITEQLVNGHFAGVGGDFWGIYDPLLRNNDEYFVLKDFAPYMDAWSSLGRLYKQTSNWQKISLMNIAKAGYFSSDRTIKEYAEDIWHIRR
jgi:starch phosphorylase